MASSSISPEFKSSIHIMEHITATLDYNVTNYPQIKGMDVGKFVSSPIFRVGGYDWDIKFYPAGQSSTCASYTSCFLRCLNEDADVNAKFTLRILMETKGQEEVASFGTEEHTIVSGKPDWGSEKFVGRSKLDSVSHLGDGGFTIRCVLTVRKESPPQELELVVHVERMLRDGTGADITFSVGGREYRAHRFVLAARSPEFRKLLFGDPLMGKDMPRVENLEVVDVDPSIFEMMLHYIYTDSLPPSEDDEAGGYGAAVMRRLLVAANTYGLDRLKFIYEKELCKKVDRKTVTTMLEFAYQHNYCKRLKDTCLQAFRRRQKGWTPY